MGEDLSASFVVWLCVYEVFNYFEYTVDKRYMTIAFLLMLLFGFLAINHAPDAQDSNIDPNPGYIVHDHIHDKVKESFDDTIQMRFRKDGFSIIMDFSSQAALYHYSGVEASLGGEDFDNKGFFESFFRWGFIDYSEGAYFTFFVPGRIKRAIYRVLPVTFRFDQTIPEAYMDRVAIKEADNAYGLRLEEGPWFGYYEPITLSGEIHSTPPSIVLYKIIHLC
jgi:hypothetical protein